MSEPIQEMSINLPIVPPGTMGADVAAAAPDPASVPAIDYPEYDITANQTLPVDISQEHSHISVWSDSCTPVASDGPCALFDLVLTVCVTDPTTGTCKTYKMVKRLSMDKVKLACDAECMSPVSIVEAEESAAEVKKEMDAFYVAKRAREMAGLREAVGSKIFKVTFTHVEEDKRTPHVMEISAVRDRAHARYVFETKHQHMFKDPKITRVEEVA